jgi:hypothetical protein
MNYRPLGTSRYFDQNPLRRILSFQWVVRSDIIRMLNYKGLSTHNSDSGTHKPGHCESAATPRFRLPDSTHGGRSNLKSFVWAEDFRLPRTAHEQLGWLKGYRSAVLAMTLPANRHCEEGFSPNEPIPKCLRRPLRPPTTKVVGSVMLRSLRDAGTGGVPKRPQQS